MLPNQVEPGAVRNYGHPMIGILVTAVMGLLFASATAFMVLLYWLMVVVFRVLQVLTYPLHFLWRTLRAGS